MLFATCESEKRLFDRTVALDVDKPKRIARIHNCGTESFAFKNRKTGEIRVQANFCEHRLCPKCRFKRQYELGERLSLWLGKVKKKEYRLITFTVRSNGEPLAELIDHAVESLKRVRNSKIWKHTQQCGRGVIEVTYNPDGSGWHPHIHVIAKGDYIPRRDLIDAWKNATGTSWHVDVRPIKSGDKAARYVSKYVGKMPNLEGHPDRDKLFREYYKAMAGRRLVISYGGVGPLPELETEGACQDDPSLWEPLGDWNLICARAKAGDVAAGRLVGAWLSRGSVESEP